MINEVGGVGVVTLLRQLVSELVVRLLEDLILEAHEEVEHPLPLRFAPSSRPMNFAVVNGQPLTLPSWCDLFCRRAGATQSTPLR